MNNRFIGAAKNQARSKRKKNILISIVILIELIAIAMVASFAWVETVSSIKLQTGSSAPLTVDTYVFTDAMIGKKPGTVDLGGYFKQAGDMHLAPCSSADGKNFYFPKLAANGTSGSTSYQTGANSYRKGTVSDKNTNYLSVTFRLKVDDTVDFFFNAAPASFPDDVRVSITAQSEGSNETSVTKIYANSASTAAVVNSTSSTGTGATAVESFASHIKGSGSTNRLFYVGADETKIVTINIWLQKTTMESNMAAVKALSNLVLVSSFTPRKVTLYPTSTWDTNNPTYYAWCYKSGGSRLYKLQKGDDGHYTFEYNGTYNNLVFVRACTDCTVTDGIYTAWPFTTTGADSNSTKMWNQTENLDVPATPVDPSYIIRSMTGGTASKSNGYWEEPVTVNLDYVTNQGSAWGTLEGKSYLTDTSSAVIETAKSSGGTHTNKIHARHNQSIELKATAKSGYRFDGWYTDAAGTTAASGASTTSPYTPTVSEPAGGEVTYYAKFVKTYTFTINRYLDGSSSSEACGTIKINGVSSSSGTAAKKTVDSGTSLTYSAAAATGYSLEGIYTLSSDGEQKYAPGASDSSITLTSNTTYFARFTTNTHAVYLRRIGTTGSSTVQYANETAATSVDKTGVKYNTSVTIHANPAAGYKFVGWYTNSSGTGTAESTSADYTFTLGDNDVTYYAKFVEADYYLTGYINGGDVSGTTHHFTAGSNGVYTYTYTFTGGAAQYITIYDGSKAYHPGSVNAGSGTTGTQYNSYIAGDDSNNPVPYYKWKVDAASGAKVTFTWNASTKTLSWTITYRVYFKNNCNFSDVYVVLLNSSYWDNNNGSGAYGYTMHQMSYDSTKGLYYYDIGSTKPSSTYIAFTEADQSGYGNFQKTKAVYRGDFDLKTPVYNAPTSKNETKNSTDYYSNGSWIKYS